MPAAPAAWILRAFAPAAAVAFALLVSTAPAQAYPQWQFVSGASRCSQCHFSPSGGGLITGYGRDVTASEMSTFEGDGAFLHGAVTLPGWLALGGDLRAAYLAKDVQDPNGTTRAAFPMQADLHARVSGGDFSAHATVGLRGRSRGESEPVPDSNFQPISASRFISREHYIMWRPQALGPYVRGGRFYAPFGLRFAEHVTYVRRDLGFNQLEETYNVSGGLVKEAWEGHLTVSIADFARNMGGREAGVSGYAERRLLNDHAAVGAQAKLAFGDGADRGIVGAVGKLYAPRLRTLFLAEANLVHLVLDEISYARDQFVGALGLTVFPYRGVNVTLLGERSHVDLKVRDAAYDAATLLLAWFPLPHLEAQLMARVQRPAGGQNAAATLLQLHYYF